MTVSSEPGAIRPLLKIGEIFSISEASALSVTSVSPDSEATGVARNTNVTATFSEAMDQSTLVTDPTTLTSTNVKLYERVKKKIRRKGRVRRVWRWVPVSAQVSYDTATKTVTLDPYGASSETLLDPNRSHLVVISTGVKDESGNALTQDYRWTFTTSAADKPTCDESLQSLIDAAAAESVVEAPGGCVYRERVTIDKPLTLKASTGAEIRGSDVWTGWTKSGSYWTKGTLPSFPAHGSCRPNTSRCLWPEQVFFDGKPLVQVASSPNRGQFAVDANRHVLLADNPRGHTVEVSTRTQWVLGKSENVTIEGFTMKHAANDAQTGAIMNQPGPTTPPTYPKWKILNNSLSDAHGITVFLRNRDIVVRNNDIFRAGQLGIGGGGPNTIVEGNRLYDNNTEDFEPGWEAGGLKLATSGVTGAKVIANQVYGNQGSGLWCDGSCKDVVFQGNQVAYNERIGILYEISDQAKIFDNVLYENGWGRFDSNQGAGIMVSNSRDVEVYNNTLAWNADGIGVLRMNRNNPLWDDVKNVHIHDNVILAKDYSSDTKTNFALSWIAWDAQLFDSAANNRGANNKYWYPDPERTLTRFSWGEESWVGYAMLDHFNATLGEENGRYLTDAEKDAIVSSKKLPTSPQLH